MLTNKNSFLHSKIIIEHHLLQVLLNADNEIKTDSYSLHSLFFSQIVAGWKLLIPGTLFDSGNLKMSKRSSQAKGEENNLIKVTHKWVGAHGREHIHLSRMKVWQRGGGHSQTSQRIWPSELLESRRLSNNQYFKNKE